MVTKLYYFASKKAFISWCKKRKYDMKACEAAWTGPGYYYARRKDYISKHVEHLDLRRGGKEGRGPWRHTHDIEKAVRSIKHMLSRHAREKAAKRLEKRKLPRRLRKKIVEATEARIAARAARKAKAWTRSKAVQELADYLWRNIPRRYKQGKDKAWTYVAVLALAKSIIDRAREKGVDPYQYDWKELIDWSLGYNYAKELVRQVMGRTMKEVIDEHHAKWKHYKERYDERRAAELLEQELDAITKYELDHLDEFLF